MAIAGLGSSGAESILSLLNASGKSTAPLEVPSAGNEGDYVQTSRNISHPITTDIHSCPRRHFL